MAGAPNWETFRSEVDRSATFVLACLFVGWFTGGWLKNLAAVWVDSGAWLGLPGKPGKVCSHDDFLLEQTSSGFSNNNMGVHTVI